MTHFNSDGWSAHYIAHVYNAVKLLLQSERPAEWPVKVGLVSPYRAQLGCSQAQAEVAYLENPTKVNRSREMSCLVRASTLSHSRRAGRTRCDAGMEWTKETGWALPPEVAVLCQKIRQSMRRAKQLSRINAVVQMKKRQAFPPDRNYLTWNSAASPASSVSFWACFPRTFPEVQKPITQDKEDSMDKLRMIARRYHCHAGGHQRPELTDFCSLTGREVLGPVWVGAERGYCGGAAAVRSGARGTRGVKAKVMQPMFQLPPMPAHLLQDSVRLPLNYQPETWAMDLVEEWGYTKQLAAADAYPTLSVLLGGPSGVGKSTAARWIASKLGLPVFSLLLSGTIDSYMGNTWAKAISSALSSLCASTVPGVLILDELDAISASREAKHQDVGEIWRVTNTFIQCLDHFHAGYPPIAPDPGT